MLVFLLHRNVAILDLGQATSGPRLPTVSSSGRTLPAPAKKTGIAGQTLRLGDTADVSPIADVSVIADVSQKRASTSVSSSPDGTLAARDEGTRGTHSRQALLKKLAELQTQVLKAIMEDDEDRLCKLETRIAEIKGQLEESSEH